MEESTKTAYRKLARHFYTTRLDGEVIDGTNIATALIKSAPGYQTAYWRRLRNALEFDQCEKGHTDWADIIAETKNPMTSSGAKKKPKRRRVKSVKEEDSDKLFQAIIAPYSVDTWLLAALNMAKHLGCRPNEMLGVRVLSENRVYIPGSKKTEDRGLDRTIILPNRICNIISWSEDELARVPEMKSSKIARIQSRLERLTKKLWPRRKARLTLYSFRHQLGSDLKASGRGRREIAYIMGHQSTKSVDVYGDSRTGSGREIEVDPEANLEELIRVNHEPPYSQQIEWQELNDIFESNIDFGWKPKT